MFFEEVQARVSCHQRTEQLLSVVQHRKPMLDTAREGRDAAGPGLHGIIGFVV